LGLANEIFQSRRCVSCATMRGTTSLLRKTTMELRIGTTGHLGYGIVQKLTFARFLASFDFRLFQHYPVESRCARYAVRCPVIPEADFVFDSRDVRLLVSPDRGSAARLGLQTRGHFVTQFTFISEFGNKGAALSDEMGPSTALTQGTLGDECTRQHHPLHHHDGDRRVRRT